jgi:hypothetical protein
MLYVQITRDAGRPTSAKVVTPVFGKDDFAACGIESRSQWKSFEEVEAIAKLLGEGYIATDAGSHVSPRYDVQELPNVGADVSYSFNGDTYPCGKIVKISDGLHRRIETSDGSVFWRRGRSGSWIKDGTWFLVAGHHYEQNPSF